MEDRVPNIRKNMKRILLITSEYRFEMKHSHETENRSSYISVVSRKILQYAKLFTWIVLVGNILNLIELTRQMNERFIQF